MSAIPLSQKKVDAIKKMSWYEDQQVLYAAKLNVGNSKGKFTKQSFVIVPGKIMVLKKKMMGKVKAKNQYNIVELKGIQMEKGNICFIKFGERLLVIQTTDITRIMQALLSFYSSITYKIVGLTPIEFQNCNGEDYLKQTARPKTSLKSRMIAFSYLYNTPIPEELLKKFGDYDNNPTSTYVINISFEADKCIKAVASALAWESSIENLILDEFAPNCFETFIKFYLEKASNVKSIQFTNYTTKRQYDFDIEKTSTISIEEIKFNNCSTHITSSLLPTLCMLKGSVKKFIMERCPATKKLLSEITRYFISLHCFTNLEEIVFENLTINGFIINDFASNLTQMKALKKISMIKFDFDGAKILDSIFSNSSSISEIILSSNNFSTSVETDPEKITDNLRVVDISHSGVNSVFLRDLICSLCGKARKHGLIVNCSGVKVEDGSEGLLYGIQLENFHPAIAELNWSGVPLTVNDTMQLTNLLRTQTGLLHLDVSRCFKRSFEPNLRIIAAFVVEASLKGISVGSKSKKPMKAAVTNFLKRIQGSGVTYLDVSRCEGGEECFTALSEFLKKTPSVEELHMDGMKPPSLEFYVSSMSEILENQNIIHFQYPAADFASLKIEEGNEPKAMKPILKVIETKHSPTTIDERLRKYEEIETVAASNVLLQRRRRGKFQSMVQTASPEKKFSSLRGIKSFAPQVQGGFVSSLAPSVSTFNPDEVDMGSPAVKRSPSDLSAALTDPYEAAEDPPSDGEDSEEAVDLQHPEFMTIAGLNELMTAFLESIEAGDSCSGGDNDPYLRAMDLISLCCA